MSVINPYSANHGYRPTSRSVQQTQNNQQGQHIGALRRTGNLAFAPVDGVFKTLTSGIKGSGVAAATVGGLVYTKHPILATFAGLSSLVAVPLYAVGSGIGRFFRDIKTAVMGHTAPKH